MLWLIVLSTFIAVNIKSITSCGVAKIDAPECYWPASSSENESGKLVLVHVFFRHGQRTPQSLYPKDPNKDSVYWLEGSGQLTPEGRRQVYALGVGLRRRYGHLMSEERAWKSVSTISSEITRTLMSAETVLAGLLPPNGTDRWSDLMWQPAPVITRDSLASSPACPKLHYLIAKNKTEPSETDKKLYRYLTKHSGKKIHSDKGVENLYTCLDIERQLGLPVPEWTDSVLPEPMRSITGRKQARSTANHQLSRLRVGPLVNILLNDSIQDRVPVNLYSTHDTTITALMNSLGLFDGIPPGFTATLSWELRRTESGSINVELWYRNSPGLDLQLLRFPGCERTCSLGALKEIYGRLIPEDYKMECELDVERIVSTYQPDVESEFSTLREAWPILLVALSIGFLIFVVLFALHQRKKKIQEYFKSQYESYQ